MLDQRFALALFSKVYELSDKNLPNKLNHFSDLFNPYVAFSLAQIYTDLLIICN